MASPVTTRPVSMPPAPTRSSPAKLRRSRSPPTRGRSRCVSSPRRPRHGCIPRTFRAWRNSHPSSQSPPAPKCRRHALPAVRRRRPDRNTRGPDAFRRTGYGHRWSRPDRLRDTLARRQGEAPPPSASRIGHRTTASGGWQRHLPGARSRYPPGSWSGRSPESRRCLSSHHTRTRRHPVLMPARTAADAALPSRSWSPVFPESRGPRTVLRSEDRPTPRRRHGRAATGRCRSRQSHLCSPRARVWR